MNYWNYWIETSQTENQTYNETYFLLGTVSVLCLLWWATNALDPNQRTCGESSKRSMTANYDYIVAY